MDFTGCLSKTGLKVVPPSSDFHTPPDAAPTINLTLPSFSCRPATAAMRPDMVADPMLRTPRPEMAALSGAGTFCAAAGLTRTAAAVARSMVRSILHPLWRAGRGCGLVGRFGGSGLGSRFSLRLVRGVGRTAGSLRGSARTARLGEEGRIHRPVRGAARDDRPLTLVRLALAPAFD